MRGIRRIAALIMLILLAALVRQATHPSGTFAQSGCPPPTYTNQVFPWAQGTTVNFSFDVYGTEVGDSSNPSSKFSLDATSTFYLTTGIQEWNGVSTADGSNVTFNANSGGASTFTWTISVAWPKANVTYTGSNGQSYTLPVDGSCSPQPCTEPAAATFYLPDHNSSGGYTGTAAAAVTLLNTNGTYSAFGNVYPDWDQNGAGFNTAMEDIGTHEAGHGFGLGDQSQCGDVMSPWGPATSSNPSGGTNNQGGCSSDIVTTCDDQEVQSNPNGLYAPSGGGGGDPGQDLCNPTCGTGQSPIIIDTGGQGFVLTAANGGVRFDISGTGHPIQMAWTAPGIDNAFLALPGSDGLVHDGKQLFGNFTPQPPSAAPNGFIALSLYDLEENGGNGDGVIDSRDAIFASLRLWIDANHDGISQPEELHTLPSLGVNSISLAYKWSKKVDQYGNVFRYRAKVNPDDPDASHVDRTAYDVFLVTLSSSATAKNLIQLRPSPANAQKRPVPVQTKGGMLSTTGTLR